ncbi:hypothetical protein BS50DRAFT_634254 [Corynespora cassiicola Philippines]|uniref:Major facilitator superfamily (MFS) profile domain-containing protein n=1 Tax=Corynespora cassiicola Philippines TaxID=1448308 RepID=A0A2T2NMW5_CORCC|nr:hypothetical protein BS50DRAFT_634254 [Corynespora cassiicola Philippines]
MRRRSLACLLKKGVNQLVIINAVGIPVRPLLGLVADRYFGSLRTVIVSTTFLAIMLYVWIAIRGVSSLKLGVRFGMVCSTLAFASLAGPPTAGAFIESSNVSFLKAQIWAGSVTIAAAFFIGAAKWTQVKFDRPAQELRSGIRDREEQDPSGSEDVEVGDDGRAKK